MPDLDHGNYEGVNIFSKMISATLVFLLINLAFANVALANDKSEKTARKREAKITKHAAKVKKGVNKLGAGEDSIVKIKLRDKTRIKGYISEISEENFTVMDETGNSIPIEYRNVKQIKGNNLHAGVWIAIGAGIAIGVLFFVMAIGLRNGS